MNETRSYYNAHCTMLDIYCILEHFTRAYAQFPIIITSAASRESIVSIKRWQQEQPCTPRGSCGVYKARPASVAAAFKAPILSVLLTLPLYLLLYIYYIILIFPLFAMSLPLRSLMVQCNASLPLFAFCAVYIYGCTIQKSGVADSSRLKRARGPPSSKGIVITAARNSYTL